MLSPQPLSTAFKTPTSTAMHHHQQQQQQFTPTHSSPLSPHAPSSPLSSSRPVGNRILLPSPPRSPKQPLFMQTPPKRLAFKPVPRPFRSLDNCRRDSRRSSSSSSNSDREGDNARTARRTFFLQKVQRDREDKFWKTRGGDDEVSIDRPLCITC